MNYVYTCKLADYHPRRRTTSEIRMRISFLLVFNSVCFFALRFPLSFRLQRWWENWEEFMTVRECGWWNCVIILIFCFFHFCFFLCFIIIIILRARDNAQRVLLLNSVITLSIPATKKARRFVNYHFFPQIYRFFLFWRIRLPRFSTKFIIWLWIIFAKPSLWSSFGHGRCLCHFYSKLKDTTKFFFRFFKKFSFFIFWKNFHFEKLMIGRFLWNNRLEKRENLPTIHFLDLPIAIVLNYWEKLTIMALTMSFSLFLSAFMAFPRETLAWHITNSTSFSSTPVSSTSSSDSSWIGATTWGQKNIEKRWKKFSSLVSPLTFIPQNQFIVANQTFWIEIGKQTYRCAATGFGRRN